MKNILIALFLTISFGNLAQAQIIDSLPYLKKDLLFKETLKPVLSAVIYNEGVAALKDHLDPKFKPPTKGWIRDSMFNHLGYYLGQAYSSNKQVKLLDEFEQTMIAVTPGDQFFDGVIFVFFELPKGKITKRGAYDPIGNSIFYPCGLPVFLESKYKDLNRVVGLVCIEKPNGQFKVVPNPFIVLGESDMRSQGLLTDDGTIVLIVENFFKSIRDNDKKAFRSVWDDDFVRSKVWTDMRPLSNYRKLPEYTSKDLKFERIVVVDLERLFPSRNLITWGGDVATFVAVYRLPKGMKASKMRAPSDILNSLVLNGLGIKDLEAQDKVVSGTPGFAPMPENSIILGPLIGTIFHEHQNPQNYVTVILHKEKGTNNFNIGMPPSVRQ